MSGRIERLIPACAGKTAYLLGFGGVLGAHPRVCGENSACRQRQTCIAGSSPRVRGKHATTHESVDIAGLIPACAGKTMGSCAAAVVMTAHPRVCGENPAAEIITAFGGGSSPRVRGKHARP